MSAHHNKLKRLNERWDELGLPPDFFYGELQAFAMFYSGKCTLQVRSDGKGKFLRGFLINPENGAIAWSYKS